MAVGAAKASAALKYGPELYTPYALESWPDSQMRKEYTRIQGIRRRFPDNQSYARRSQSIGASFGRCGAVCAF